MIKGDSFLRWKVSAPGCRTCRLWVVAWTLKIEFHLCRFELFRARASVFFHVLYRENLSTALELPSTGEDSNVWKWDRRRGLEKTIGSLLSQHEHFQHRSMMLRNATCGMTAHCQSGSAHAPLVPCVKYTFKSIWYMVLNPIFCRPLNTRLVISISISFIVSNLSWLELGCQTNVFYLFIYLCQIYRIINCILLRTLTWKLCFIFKISRNSYLHFMCAKPFFK